jgi:S1-C subfamily serine protease
MRFLRLIPDWLIYALLLAVILYTANTRSSRQDAPAPPPVLGPALPNTRPSDPNIVVEIDKPASGVGTAFSIGSDGAWLTARHVVDSCDQIGLKIDQAKYVKVSDADISKTTDTAILTSRWRRPALAQDFNSKRQLGEVGFFIGFPQGQPGEVAGKLIGRRRMVIRGRYRSNEPILAWAEIGRSRGLKGSLGGLSGGPVFDSDGEVIGLVAAESPRRGRVYTVAPQSMAARLTPPKKPGRTQAISLSDYGRRADQMRRARRIAKVVCLVK